MNRPAVAKTAAAALLLLLITGCADKNEVGQGLDDFKEKNGSGLVLEPTKSPTPSPKAKPAVTKVTPVRTAAPRVTARATPPPLVLAISINGDNAGSAFTPALARVQKGAILEWTNRDSKPHSVVADDGSLDSGLIQPGKSWRFTTKKLGKVNYHDGKRPYAVAAFEVV